MESLVNANELETADYGSSVLDKSRYSDKQVLSFRYNQRGVDVIRSAFIGAYRLNLMN